jgi:hypothetical protein
MDGRDREGREGREGRRKDGIEGIEDGSKALALCRTACADFMDPKNIKIVYGS